MHRCINYRAVTCKLVERRYEFKNAFDAISWKMLSRQEWRLN
jgi:hypothetical protein